RNSPRILADQCQLIDGSQQDRGRMPVDIRIHNVNRQRMRAAGLAVSAIPFAFTVEAKMPQPIFESISKPAQTDRRMLLPVRRSQLAVAEWTSRQPAPLLQIDRVITVAGRKFVPVVREGGHLRHAAGVWIVRRVAATDPEPNLECLPF